jgi:hypothetical protein
MGSVQWRTAMPETVNTAAKKVSDLLAGKRRGKVDSSKLLNDLMERWGGTERFAQDVVGEFGAAKEGTFTRQKILEMVQKLIVTNSVHNLSPPERPEDLEDDEIQERLDHYIARVAAGVAAKQDADSAPRSTFVPPEEREEDPPPDFG